LANIFFHVNHKVLPLSITDPDGGNVEFTSELGSWRVRDAVEDSGLKWDGCPLGKVVVATDRARKELWMFG